VREEHMDRLKDRVTIVTGGASGIGRATALLFAREGAKLLICDLNDARSAETIQAIQAARGQARFRHADVTIAAEVQSVVDGALEHFHRLDVLVNNAGISLGDSVLDIDEPTWDRNLAVVLKGPYLFTRAALPAMRQRRSGVIVNVASVNGLLGLKEDAY